MLDNSFVNHRQMDKIIETVMVKDFKDKDLFPPGPRKYVLYLGDEQFEFTYRLWIKAKRDAYEIEKSKKKGLLKASEGGADVQKMDEDIGNDDSDGEIPVDKEEIFLRQFPGMVAKYRNNKDLFRKFSRKPGFNVKTGGWLPPTCCSMVVNVIQFMLTISSIMMYKSDANAFWLPQMIREDLTLEFNNVKDEATFWDFTQNTLGKFVFFADLPKYDDSPEHSIHLTKFLNEYDL